MKNEYDLLNDIEVDFDEYDDVELSEREKEKMKNRFRSQITSVQKKNRRPLIASAIVVVALSSVVLSNGGVWASVVKIGQQIEQFLDKPDDSFTGYKQTVNQTVNDQNVKITLNEMMLDDEQILLSLNVNANELDKRGLDIENVSAIRPGALRVSIDGMDFFDSTYSLQRENKQTEDGSWNYLYNFKLEQADTNSDGKLDMHHYNILDNLDLNKNYEIKVAFNSVEYDKKGASNSIGRYSDSFGEIKGNWVFETKVNGSKIASDTKIYPVDKEIQIDTEDIEGIMRIKEVRVSPVSMKIHYTFEYRKGYNQRNGLNAGLRIEDEHGRQLLGHATGEGTDTLFEMDAEYSINQNVKKVKIIPYAGYLNGEATYLKDQAFELTLTK
ncbi:DUF4179 domain-containing protein [Priestia megaterium]|nr:DUF4179 domain-containing protein [Priestia megaterium]